MKFMNSTARVMITLEYGWINRVGIFYKESKFKIVFRFDRTVRKSLLKLNLRTGKRLIRFIKKYHGVFDHLEKLDSLDFEIDLKLGVKFTDYTNNNRYGFSTHNLTTDPNFLESLVPLIPENKRKILHEYLD